MSDRCPAIVIAGTGSGVGKTSLTLGIARALARRGLRVQTFKVGPDFLDPGYLAAASARTCYNLDGWMTSRAYVMELFARATTDADVAIVEGVMGLFDGASPVGLEGSTAEVAAWLDAPVVLVVNAHGAARSLAATVRGFATFDPAVRMAGVIANYGGSPRHRAWLAESLAAAELPELLGFVPRDALPKLSSRHLGLVSADAATLDPTTIDALADACAEHVDLSRLVVKAGHPDIDHHPERSLSGHPERSEGSRQILRCAQNDSILAERDAHTCRIGVARDATFHFYYADNLQALEAAGATLVPFSPLAEEALPPDLDAIYLGGGYPEVHAEQLAANARMLASVREFAASGRVVYAECGGLMYLGRGLTTLDGRRFPLCGVLPVETAMLPALRALGYVEVTTTAACLWGEAGWDGRGHEFHYSEITLDESPGDGWHVPYAIRRRRSEASEPAGFARGGVLASYVHLHWAAQPAAVRWFLERCRSGRSVCEHHTVG
jgi:cobyrinic acid a,c-diamide synthase